MRIESTLELFAKKNSHCGIPSSEFIYSNRSIFLVKDCFTILNSTVTAPPKLNGFKGFHLYQGMHLCHGGILLIRKVFKEHSRIHEIMLLLGRVRVPG